MPTDEHPRERSAHRIRRMRANAVFAVVCDNPMATRRRISELAREARPDLWTDPTITPKRVLSWLHARGEVLKHHLEPPDDPDDLGTMDTPPTRFTVVPRSERQAARD